MQHVLARYPRFMSSLRRKRKLQKGKKEKSKNVVIIVAKIMVLENPGIDPGTSRMRSGRSTIWANSPGAYPTWETYEWKRQFPSSLVPVSEGVSKCETILMKMTFICMKMKLHAELILIWMVSHLDSFWNRDTRELGNGLLLWLCRNLHDPYYSFSR